MIRTCMPISEQAKSKLSALAKSLGFTSGIITELYELAYDDPDLEGISIKIQLSRKIPRDVGFKAKER